MNSSSWEREVHEGLLVAGTGHFEIVKPVEASIRLIVPSDMKK